MAEASRTITGYPVPAEARPPEIDLLVLTPAGGVGPASLRESVAQLTLEYD